RQALHRDRRRQRAPGDEAEIARAGRGDEAGFGSARESVDDGRRIEWRVGKGASESGPQLFERGGRPDRTVPARRGIRARDCYRAVESVRFSHVTIALVTASATCLSRRFAYSDTS